MPNYGTISILVLHTQLCKQTSLRSTKETCKSLQKQLRYSLPAEPQAELFSTKRWNATMLKRRAWYHHLHCAAKDFHVFSAFPIVKYVTKVSPILGVTSQCA